MYELIPDELKQLKQWVCWKGEPDPARPGKIKKMPINPKTGGKAQSNNPDTWTDYPTAVKASRKHSGIGLMLGGGFFGVDIDDIDDAISDFKAGGIDNIVSEFVYSLESYAEYSQSGKGLHIICKGTLPEGGRRKGNVEMYQSGRFFIMTGDAAAEFGDVADCTESIKMLHAKYIGNPEPARTKTAVCGTNDLDEDKIIEIALKSKQGTAFETLYRGSWEGFYKSQSDADLAFCNMLAFWCAKDKGRMDAIFRRSGLMRDKWDRKTGNSTYGEITLNKALSSCNSVFTPGYQPEGGTEDFGLILDEQPYKFYSYDDTGNAQRLTERYGGVMRYNHTYKRWYIYNGKRWLDDETGAVKRLADSLIDEMGSDYAWVSGEDQEKALTKHIKYSRSSKGKQAMLKESEHLVSIRPQDFDKDPFLLNVQNGTIDLRTGKLLSHDAKQYLSKICNVEYSDKIDCPQWLDFLNTVFDGDEELICYMQKVAGIFLTGSIEEQAVFFLYGNGRNGKSTFVEALHNILGDYAMTTQPEVFLVSRSSNVPEYELARMKGARLVTTAEPTDGAKLNESIIKQMTGGEEIACRVPYGMPFSFRPEYKLCMTTNYKPVIRGRDEGIWRRVHLIPFSVQIPKEQVDKKLRYKLQKEYSGILNWAVEGCLLWQKEGIEMPQAVLDSVAEYRSEMDLIGIFLEECTEVNASGRVSADELFRVYLKWVQANNERDISKTKFGTEIKIRYERIKSNGCIYYKGLQIRPELVFPGIEVAYDEDIF